MNGHEVAPGQRIDGFEVGPCVHEGAMARLYHVREETPGAFPLLMKVPRLGRVDSAEAALAFETESLVLPRLRSAHAPRFVACGDLRRVPYIVLERIDGECLGGRVGSRAAAGEVARVGAAVADALHDIHGRGVVHLDVKPDNVMLRPNGSAVLVDFALAHHARLPDLHAEESRFAAGSAPYVSPEQVRGLRGDPRSDVFALGVLMYELATGELPFGVPATDGGLRDRLWREPAPPRSLVPELPGALQEVILRCLEPDAQARYQSAAHAAFDLRHLDVVAPTERGARLASPGWMAQAARWWRSRHPGGMEAIGVPEPAHVPVVLVAVDTSHPEDPRHPALQQAVRRLLAGSREYRLVCVSVIRAGPDVAADTDDVDAAYEHHVRLRHWCHPLKLPPERMSLHVIESAEPAQALLAYAERNHVDLLVLGAPDPDDRALAWWRSVASSVTSHARCSVHVVRRHAREAAVD